MTLLDLLNNAATRGGLSADAAGLKDLLSRADLAQITVPADVAGAVEGLLSLDAAKNNPLLKRHFVAAAYDGIDKKLGELLADATELLPEAALAEILAEKSTGQRVEKAIKALLDAKPARKGDGEAQRQVADLNKTLADLKAQHTAALTAKDQEFVGYRREQAFDAALADIKWANYYPAHLRGQMAKGAVDAELAKVGGQLVFGPDGRLALKQKANPELDLFLDNKAVSLPDLVQRVAAENGFIAVTPPPAGGGSGPGTPPPVQPPQGGGATPPTAGLPPAISNAFAAARRNLETAGS